MSSARRTARISVKLLGKDPNSHSQKRPGGPALKGVGDVRTPWGQQGSGWGHSVVGGPGQQHWAPVQVGCDPGRAQPPAAETGPRTQPPSEFRSELSPRDSMGEFTSPLGNLLPSLPSTV